MKSVNYTFILSLSIIALGYILKHRKILTVEHGKSAAKIIFNVTLPALIIKTISSIELNKTMLMMPVISLLFSVLPLSLVFIILKNKPAPEKGIAAITAAGFNVGLFSFPLIEGLFGQEGLKYMAMFDFGNAFVIFGIVYLLGYSLSDLTDQKLLTPTKSLRLLFSSIPFMSYLAAILINITKFHIPVFAGNILDILARSNMALALLTLGLTLSFNFEKSHWDVIVKIVAVRYAAGISAGIILFFLLPYSRMIKLLLLFGLTLPVGLSSIPFAVEFGYDSEVTGTINNITIVASFLIMWGAMLIF